MMIVNILGGLVLLTVGATILVNGATAAAQSFGVSKLVIGLTVVAIGTSLPELFALVISAKSGSSSIGLGNVIGSNIINILGVLGIGLMIAPLTINRSEMDMLTIGTFVAASIYLLIAMLFRGGLTRIDGAALFAAFLVFTWLSYSKSTSS
jgi:cation:H+ antiporter